MTEQEYRSAPGISQTQVNWFLQSPALYEARLKKPMEPTEAMILGSYFDALLTGEGLDGFYVCQFDGRTKEGKAEREANAGKRIISSDKAADCKRWADCTKAAFTATDGIRYQVEMFGEIEGIACKGKADAAADHKLYDFKLLADASPEGFAKVCAQGYDIQAAMYQTLYGQSIGLKTVDEFIEIPFEFICQEKHEFDVTPKFTGVYQIDMPTLYKAHAVLRDALKQMVAYEKIGIFPGYGRETITPKWGRK